MLEMRCSIEAPGRKSGPFVPNERQGERILSLHAGQSRGGIKYLLERHSLGQLARLGSDFPSDGFQLLAVGQFVVDHDKQLLEFHRQVDHRGSGTRRLAGDGGTTALRMAGAQWWLQATG